MKEISLLGVIIYCLQEQILKSYRVLCTFSSNGVAISCFATAAEKKRPTAITFYCENG